MAASELTFELQQAKARIHPAAILALLDAHGRKDVAQESIRFAVSPLLGTVTQDNRSGPVSVDIIDCFAIPCSVDEVPENPLVPPSAPPFVSTLALSVGSFESTLQLRQKIFPKTQVVGWAITSVEHLALLTRWTESGQDKLFTPSKALQSPLILALDTSFRRTGTLLGGSLLLTRTSFSQYYRRVAMSVETDSADTATLAAIARVSTERVTGPMEKQQQRELQSESNVRTALMALRALLLPCQAYISKVVQEGKESNVALGREISRALCVESLLQSNQVEAACEAGVRDAMMVASLTSVAKQQISAAEQLAVSFL